MRIQRGERTYKYSLKSFKNDSNFAFWDAFGKHTMQQQA